MNDNICSQSDQPAHDERTHSLRESQHLLLPCQKIHLQDTCNQPINQQNDVKTYARHFYKNMHTHIQVAKPSEKYYVLEIS